MTHIREKAARFGNDPFALYLLAQAEKVSGNAASAEQAVDRLLAVQPSHVQGTTLKSLLVAQRAMTMSGAARLQTAAEAKRLAVAANKLDPDNPSYLDSLGWAQFKRGDLVPAEKNLTRAAAALPRNSVIQDHLGDLLARLGRPKDAATAWTRALEGDSDELNRASVEKKIRDIQRRR